MDIEATKGDNEFYDLIMIRNSLPVNLEGPDVKVWFTAKREEDDDDANAVIQLNSVDDPTQVVFADRPSGQLYIQLVPEDTVDVDDENLIYDVQVKEQSGRITTIQKGKFRLRKDITRTTI